MGSSSIHLVRKRCSLRSQPVLQLREGSETGEPLGVSVQWETGAQQEEGSISSSLGEGGCQVVAEVLPLLPGSGSIHCTPHDLYIRLSIYRALNDAWEQFGAWNLTTACGRRHPSVMTYLLACFVPLEKLKRPD